MYLAIRLRGGVGVPHKARLTLEALNLKRKHNASLVDESDSSRGQLQAARAYITWGEVDEDTLAVLLAQRGKLLNGKRLTQSAVEGLGFKNCRELAGAVLAGAEMRAIGLRPFFALAPPRHGFGGSVKRFWPGGALGYRGKAINKLALSMIG